MDEQNNKPNFIENDVLEAGDWKKKAEKFLQDNIFYFIVFAMSAGYMLLGIVNIIQKDKSIVGIIADSAMSLTMGLTIGKLLGLQGILRGEKSLAYREAKKKHNDKCIAINPMIDKMPKFCRERNNEELRYIQTAILGAEAMTYDDFANGYYERAYSTLSKREKKAYKKAKKVKITPLTPQSIIGDDTPKNDPFFMGATKTQMIHKEDRKAWFSKVVLALVFGYFGVELVKDISYATLIWTFVQIIIFVAGGFGRYWNFYYFMYEEMPIRYQKQDNHIDTFEKWYKEHKFDEEIHGQSGVVGEVQGTEEH